MKTITKKLYTLTFTALCVSSLSAHADGLADLTNALNKLQGKAPITAKLTAEVVVNRGEGEDKVIKNGNVDVVLSDGDQGLQVTFSNQVLENIDIESNEKIKDEDADTPTLNAIDRLEATELRSYVSAASSLLRQLERATFIDEQEIQYQDTNARVLNFEMPMESIVSDKKTREYVDKFESSYQVIINEQGIPLETRLEFSGKGRAYIVLSLKAYGNGLSKFTVVDNRLVTVHQEFTSGWDSTFGEGEMTEVIQLAL